MGSSEGKIERECLVWLNKEHGGLWWKNASVGIYDQEAGTYRKGNVFQINGVSDIIGIKDGAVWFIEVKTNTGVQSMAQIAFEKQIKKHGGNYLLVRSLGELIEHFQGR